MKKEILLAHQITKFGQKRVIKRPKKLLTKTLCSWCQKIFCAPRARFCSKSCSAHWRNTQVWAKENSRKSAKIAGLSNIGRKRPDAMKRMKRMNQDPEFNKKKWKGFYKWSKANPTFLHRGGNGQLTKQQKKISELTGLPMEFIIKTAPAKGIFPSLPNHYKVDLANPIKKIAIEIDGNSHLTKKWRFLDHRKTEVLNYLGWSVLRFWNKEVDQNPEEVVQKIITFITSK